MPFSTIPSAWLDVGDPTKKEIFDTIKSNQDDLQSRLLSVESFSANIAPIIFQIDGKYWTETVPISDAAGRIRIFPNITLTSGQVYVVDAGTSGTLDVDVKYKRGAGAWTTIFTTRPSLAFGAGDEVMSSNGVLSVTSLLSGDLLRLDIITAQIGNDHFNVYLQYEIT